MRKKQFRRMAGILPLSMMVVLGVSGLTANVNAAATENWNDASSQTASWSKWKNSWAEYSKNYENVSLTPGAQASELNLAWYSQNAETPQVRFATSEDMKTGAKEFSGTQEAITSQAALAGYYSNKVTVTGLKENTAYYYQVFQNGAWQDPEAYTTKSFSNYSFLYVGDPQIGACKGQTSSESDPMAESGDNLAARNDGYNWNTVLNNALKRHSNVSFMVSAGDQVNTATNEEEYAAYLGVDALTSLPVATTIGNHDSKSDQYSLHYNNPNSFASTDTQYSAGATAAGSDYYYTYGEVLFIVLDTNNYNCATHENVIKKAVSENKDAKWRVVTFHQDIYGSGLDHSDSDGMVLRTQLTPIMDKYDIDVVLQGHDHTYSRTYQLTSDGKQHTAYDSSSYKSDSAFQSENNCYSITSDKGSGTITNPEGTVYLEANSATGSKFYNLIQTQQDYIAERSQTWTPSYSVVDVTDTSFKVTTYDATTGSELNGSSSYTIIKKDSTDTTKKQNISVAANMKKEITEKLFDLDASTDGDGALTYSSSNTSVATVSKKGIVTLKGIGTTTLTVKAAATDNYKEASITTTLTVTSGKAVVKNVKAASKKVTVNWKKDKAVSGYQVTYSYSKAFKNARNILVKKNTKTKATITKLTRGKKVYVKVRSYKNVNGAKVYGNYSSVKKVTVK